MALVDEIKALEDKIAELNMQMNALEPGVTRDQLVDDLNIATNRLAELTWNQQQIAKVVEEKVHATDVKFSVDGVDFSIFPDQTRAPLMQLVDLIVKEDRRGFFVQWEADKAADKGKYELLKSENDKNELQIEQLQNEIGGLKMEIDTLHDANIGLASDNSMYLSQLEDANGDNADLRTDLQQANGIIAQQRRELEDWQAKHKNATNEIARLESEVSDYQTAKVMGEREAQKVIDITPDAAPDIKQAMANLYTSFVNNGNINIVTKLDGSKEEVKSVDILNGTWKQVPKDAVPFQEQGQQDSEVNVGNAGLPSGDMMPPASENFHQPADVDNASNDLESDGQVLAKVVSHKERFQQIEARLTALEARI